MQITGPPFSLHIANLQHPWLISYFELSQLSGAYIRSASIRMWIRRPEHLATQTQPLQYRIRVYRVISVYAVQETPIIECVRVRE
jgi:hypothetical protein